MLISQGAFAFFGRYFDRLCVIAKNLALIFAELSLIVCQDFDRLALKLALIFAKLVLICCQDFDRLALKLALIFAKLALISWQTHSLCLLCFCRKSNILNHFLAIYDKIEASFELPVLLLESPAKNKQSPPFFIRYSWNSE